MNCPVTSFTTIAGAKTYLLNQLYQLLSDFCLSSKADTNRLLRLEAPLSGCSPLQWLSCQRHSIRIYWSNRQLDFETAGIGSADSLKSHSINDYKVLSSHLKQSFSHYIGNARYFGGLRFDFATQMDPHWLPYGNYCFILPQFEMTSDSTGTYLACNVLLDRKQDIKHKLKYTIKELEKVETVISPIPKSPSSVFLLRQNVPEKKEWFRNIETALAILKNGQAEKIVLGRSTMLLFSTAPNPLTLLSQLKAIEPFAYHFYFQPEHNSAFIGATPERLYRRQGQAIESEAVAGTCSRGTTSEEDKQFGAALLRSHKENCEHRFVCNDIESILQNLCWHVEVSREIRLLKQARVQHLYSQIYGKLRERVSDMDLIKRLHPTPAVGGSPRHMALQIIDVLEPFDRGWFAGPIGWIGSDAAEFAVGIRSAVVNDKVLRLFAGAGVVQGSVPELEWDELENKIGVFMDALQLKI